MDMIRVCALKLDWLVLHLIVCALLHPCSAVGPDGSPVGMGTLSNDAIAPSTRGSDAPTSEGGVSWEMEDKRWKEYYSRRYFYEHNETHIAMARAEAEAARRQGGGGAASTLSSALRLGTFPDLSPAENGCKGDGPHRADRDRLFFDSEMSSIMGLYVIEILAVDSCAMGRNVYWQSQNLEFCSQRWVKPEKPDALIRDNPDPLTRSFDVLVRILVSPSHRKGYYDVLADGVYFPATGQINVREEPAASMHLVGCTRKTHIPYWASYVNDSLPQMTDDLIVSSNRAMNLSVEAPAPSPSFSETPISQGYASWVDPESFRAPPLNSSTPDDCAISVTVQYPPLNCRWNWDRVLKYSIRSRREKDDPLNFDPIEGSAFHPYFRRYYKVKNQIDQIQLQRRLETGGQIVLLVLGLVCVALQIEHGRHNEESLPFVSLAMLGIQLASHFSQTSIFKDLQIGSYNWGYRYPYDGTHRRTRTGDEFHFPDWVSEDNYYAAMAWGKHVPYQAMAMTAIFMYVWIFHRVGDRRRIMKVRVVRKRPGAKDPPSDWRVVYATLAFFSLLCFLGFFAIRADQYGHLRRALTGMTANEDRYFDETLRAAHTASEDALYPALAPYGEESPFVSWRFYELSQAQWGFVNKLTGLVVSLFLVPQVVGNMQWDVQGRPLSAWFYMGIPLLQSVPHIFNIAKHLQLLPIFSSFDPYIDSIYGIYENPTPWWPMGVVLGSTLQVLAVHSQFSRSQILGASRHSRPSDSAVQMVENML